MIRLLGITGPKESGKDSAVAFIQEKMDVYRVGLADKLKDCCSLIFDISRPLFDDRKRKEHKFRNGPVYIIKEDFEAILDYYAELVDISDEERDNALSQIPDRKIVETPRELLQYVGTDFLRNMVDATIHLHVADFSEDKLNIISDVRFDNELSYVKARGGAMWYISRPMCERRFIEDKLMHESERKVESLREKCDYQLQNDQGLEEFRVLVHELINAGGLIK